MFPHRFHHVLVIPPVVSVVHQLPVDMKHRGTGRIGLKLVLVVLGRTRLTRVVGRM